MGETVNEFKIVTVGWSTKFISEVYNIIEKKTEIPFYHVLLAPYDRGVHINRVEQNNIYFIRDNVSERLKEIDVGLLASLEGYGVSTINCMIMGDRVVRHIKYSEALAYATYLAKRLIRLFGEIKPSVVIGGFDSIHSGIGLAVAKKMGIPWYAMHFSTIPKGLNCFCSKLTPDSGVKIHETEQSQLYLLAEKTYNDFLNKNIIPHAYRSANSFMAVIKRLPGHVRALIKLLVSFLFNRFDHYKEYSLRHVILTYFRRRINLLLFPKSWFITEPSNSPYVLFALHMQPESSIDTKAAFFSNQFSIIETIARSIPCNFKLLIKLHVSDGDNYSRAQLAYVKQLPGVQLVSPLVQSRQFIEQSSMIITIQGTIALEGALLGKPVLVFGESRMTEFSNVARINVVTELPDLIKKKIHEPSPTREEIIRGFVSFLDIYMPSCLNDWKRTLSDSEINDFSTQFLHLKNYIEKHKKTKQDKICQ